MNLKKVCLGAGAIGSTTLFLLLTGCSDRPAATPAQAEAAPEDKANDALAGLQSQVVENYADVVLATYEDSLNAAKELKSAAQALVANPSQETLAAARAAWKAARIPYLQSEVFRFYGGPIDAEEGGVEGLLNAWPMDEVYVDYVVEVPEGGIINDPETFPEITAELLIELNEKNGEANISTGYHAIEFLLWGQDLSTTGPGNRSHTDYVQSGEGPGKQAERRGRYLLALTDLLVNHLAGLVQAWQPGEENNYRAMFLKESSTVALGKIFQGMGVLSGFELSGERLMVAYETQAQEDEQSCFSDNTHVDMIENVRGIQNVYLGKYRKATGELVEGPSLYDLLAAKDPNIATALADQIAASLAAAQAIPEPFDQALLGEVEAPGRKAIQALIGHLEQQADLLVRAAALFDIPLNIEGAEAES